MYEPTGPLMCDIWLAIDYLNSNAAVLNMLIISFDRYFSVTRPLTYRAKRTTKHACLMISFAWLLSLTIWTPAIFTYPYYKGRTVQGTDKCEIEFVKANTYLTFVTAILAFYIPVAIMIYLYWRIWLETKKRYRDLTTLFLVSGVGAAAPSRPRPPAAAALSASGRQAATTGSLWARNLASRLHAPSLMRGLPQKAAILTSRRPSPAKLCTRPAAAAAVQPPVLTLISKRSPVEGQQDTLPSTRRGPPEYLALDAANTANTANTQVVVGCHQTAHYDASESATDTCKPSHVVQIIATSGESGQELSKMTHRDQQVSLASQKPNLGRQSCKRRPGERSHAPPLDCRACGRDKAMGAGARHKCALRKSTCCCCSATGAQTVVQHRTKHDSTNRRHRQHKASCRQCTNLTCGSSGAERTAVVNHSRSPRSKPRSTGQLASGFDLLSLADDATITASGRATTSGSRSSVCQKLSKIHPKEEGEEEVEVEVGKQEVATCAESDEAPSPETRIKLLVDVATSPINFSTSSLATLTATNPPLEHESVTRQRCAPLTPVSPEVEDFETRIVSYGHAFHFETDDPKLASRDECNQQVVFKTPSHHHNHHHHQHHHHHHQQQQQQHRRHHLHNEPSISIRSKATAQSHTAAGKNGACCQGELISTHEAACRFCQPAQLGLGSAHHSHHCHHHSHAHGHGPHAHHHHQHHHHQQQQHHHPHPHHHKHHHRKHSSPEKQRNKCPMAPATTATATNKTLEQPDRQQLTVGSSSLPILAALQSTHVATKTAPDNNAKKCGQKLTFSNILIEEGTRIAVDPDMSIVQVGPASREQRQQENHQHKETSPAVSESERELLARRNADRLKCAFDDENTDDERRRQSSGGGGGGGGESRGWLARLLDLVGLDPGDSKRSASYMKTEYRAGQQPPLEDCAGAAPGSKSLFNVLECCLCSSTLSRPAMNRGRFPPGTTDIERQRRHEVQTTDSSDTSDQQQQQQQHHGQRGKLQSQQHSSSTKSSTSSSQQHQHTPLPHETGSCSYNHHGDNNNNNNNNHHHHHHHHHHRHHHHHQHPIQPKSERKAAKTLSTLLLVFIVTWLPYNVLVLIKTLSGGEDMVPEKIWNFSYYLCYINSTINPLCYALCNAQFRRTYMRILKCKLSNEHNSTRRLVAIQLAGSGGGGGGGGGAGSSAAAAAWNKDNASRLNSSSLDGAHHLNHSSSAMPLGAGAQTRPARYRQSSASNGMARKHSGMRRS